VWKVLEFKVEIFKASQSLGNDYRYGKILENSDADLENAYVPYVV